MKILLIHQMRQQAHGYSVKLQHQEYTERRTTENAIECWGSLTLVPTCMVFHLDQAFDTRLFREKKQIVLAADLASVRLGLSEMIM